MNMLHISFGGSPDDARNAYKTWWDQQVGIELVGLPPALEQAGAGWKISVWYRKETRVVGVDTTQHGDGMQTSIPRHPASGRKR
jgi:hypothetical protein